MKQKKLANKKTVSIKVETRAHLAPLIILCESQKPSATQTNDAITFWSVNVLGVYVIVQLGSVLSNL
mgnify:CR=1 FL=1